MKTTNQQLETEIDAYFATVTPAQLAADLAHSNFEFYNTIGRKLFVRRAFGAVPVLIPPQGLISHKVPVSSPVGNYDELPLAA